MAAKTEQLQLDIRPESDIYGTYRRLAYEPWSAIAEFVDNSTANYFLHSEILDEVATQQPYLEVDVYYNKDDHSVTVTDNANGMNLEEFSRAIQLAKPPELVGRSEFGMGLKTAACWMGPEWTVTSKRLGETVEYSAQIDVDVLLRDKPRTINIQKRTGLERELHYTTVEIRRVDRYDRIFRGRTLGKIGQELGSIYRRDINEGNIEIRWQGEPVSWQLPRFKVERGVTWTKKINITVAGKKVTGWIALFETGKAAEAGFHIFRQGRLIEGGTQRGWKPYDIFKAPNSFQSQRLYGELDFDEWAVSHTKDRIERSGEIETKLVKGLENASADYIEKAKEEKGTRTPPQLTTDAIRHIVETTAEELVENTDLIASMVVSEEGVIPEREIDDDQFSSLFETLPGSPVSINYTQETLPQLDWNLDDEGLFGDVLVDHGFPSDNLIQLVLNQRHPFMEKFVSSNTDTMKALVQLLYVDAVVEKLEKKVGGLEPNIRRKIRDQFLGKLEPTSD